MRPAIDTGNLIACQPCAKAKAKCDKQLPTCSRCLYKRLKCEQRAPRRYPETAHSMQSHPQTISPPSSSSASPGDQTAGQPDATHDTMHPIYTTEHDPTFSALFAIDNFQWQQSPCPGDLNISQQPSQCSGDLNKCSPDLDINQQPARCPNDLSIMHQMDTVMGDDLSSNQFAMTFSSNQTSFNQFGSASLTSASRSYLDTLTTPPPTVPTRSSSARLVDEGWPAFRCNPKSGERINPRLGSEFLRQLEETLNDQSVWTSPDFTKNQLSYEATMSVSPVQGSLRDKLMVISQGFLSRARNTHRSASEDASPGRFRSSSSTSLTGLFILPPPAVLEAFLRTYGDRVELYMPSFCASTIDSAALVATADEKSSILLLLLMITHGAMGNAQPQARLLAAGLLEICRISMFDMMEKNVQMAAQPMMLRCALLYLNAATWSGNRWHMDLSEAQLHMYVSMVRHAGMVDARPSALMGIDSTMDADTSWDTWKSKEAMNRLAYSWVILDQETMLFHDCQPEFDIGDCNAPLPFNDELWNAKSAISWQASLQAVRRLQPQGVDSSRSLAKLFQDLMSNKLSSNAAALSFTELRLLLQPLQALLYHLHKSLLYFSKSGSQSLQQRLLTQLEEVQYLLKQWYTISRGVAQSLDQTSIVCTNMVLFHLISLNATTYLPDIERLARGEITFDDFHESLWTGKRCIEEAPHIWCHCGQVIRYFRMIPTSNRPYWWSAAIYRIALCMWAVSSSYNMKHSEAMLASAGAETIAIDALPFDHPSIVRYLRHRDGNPGLSHPDGALVSLTSPVDVLLHCIEVLKEKVPLSQLDEGISSRLSTLVERLSR